MMLFEKRDFISWAAGAVLAAGLAAGGLVSSASAQNAADVEVFGNAISVYGDTVANFEAMNVRIADPDGNLLVNVRSIGEPVAWSPSAGDPDGLYRFEVVVITVDPEAADGEDREALSRQRGSFEVQDGNIVVGQAEDEQSSVWDSTIRLAHDFLNAIGEAIIPSARAQDLQVSDVSPSIRFCDTSLAPAGCSGLAGNSYWIWGEGSNSGGFFELYNLQQDHDVIDIQNSPNDINTLTGDDNGDIGLANFQVFIDRSSGAAGTDGATVGIGTTTPVAELHIADTSPEIRFTDDSSNTNADILYNTRALLLQGTNNQTIVRLDDQAPGGSLGINNVGDVGVGTGTPTASLEVRRSNGTAQIKVDENSPTVANRFVFELENNGPPRMRFTNSDTGNEWWYGPEGTIGTGADRFVITRPGSGGGEFNIFRSGRIIMGRPSGGNKFDLSTNGNLTIAGTLTENSDVNAKEDIAPVDGDTILTQVAALPVSTWTYKDDETGARHVGPMAQDFHAAFGLGANDKTLAPRDVAGVALAGVKALQEELSKKDAMIEALQARLDALEAKLNDK